MRAGIRVVLVAARDEEARIGETVTRLREAFPDAEVVVADDGSRDGTARVAEAAGARVVRLPRLGKGQGLTLAERELAEGPLLLCDGDLEGDLRPLADSPADLAVAAFAERRGGGFGIAKRVAQALIRLRCGFAAREPLSGQRRVSERARAACFPLAAGFGAETRMTIDAVRAGLVVEEVELPLAHRVTARDARGFLHRGRQLLQLVLASGPQARNYRGLRLPLVGATVGLAVPEVAVVAAAGLADDLWSGPERGFRAHLCAGATTGTVKAVVIPVWGLWRTRSLSGALLVGLAANLLNQLDTRPGRALKAFALGCVLLGRPTRRAVAVAVLIAPYDLREMAMLGDAGANAFGALLGWKSVEGNTGARRYAVIGVLAALTLLGERRSLGMLIERTPGLRELDALGRVP
jgi:Glycosyl transferase family 2